MNTRCEEIASRQQHCWLASWLIKVISYRKKGEVLYHIRWTCTYCTADVYLHAVVLKRLMCPLSFLQYLPRQELCQLFMASFSTCSLLGHITHPRRLRGSQCCPAMHMHSGEPIVRLQEDIAVSHSLDERKPRSKGSAPRKKAQDVVGWFCFGMFVFTAQILLQEKSLQYKK